MDYPIRNVTFGGFDRQDVVRYLENFSRCAEEEKQALRDEADRQTARVAELEEENGSLRQELAEAREEAERLQAELERETARAEALESLRGLEEENRRLREEAETLKQDAEAYARFRERVGSIECEARERADALEAEASEKMHRTMVQFQERYQELIRVIESTAGHVTGELRKVEVNLSQLPRDMDQADREFDDLSVQISRGEYVVPFEGFGETAENLNAGETAGGTEGAAGAAAGAEVTENVRGGTKAAGGTETARGDREAAEERDAESRTDPAAETIEKNAAETAPERRPESISENAKLEGRPGSLRSAIRTAAAAKAPEMGRTVRPGPQNRDNRNGLFNFGTRRR